MFGDIFVYSDWVKKETAAGSRGPRPRKLLHRNAPLFQSCVTQTVNSAKFEKLVLKEVTMLVFLKLD